MSRNKSRQARVASWKEEQENELKQTNTFASAEKKVKLNAILKDLNIEKLCAASTLTNFQTIIDYDNTSLINPPTRQIFVLLNKNLNLVIYLIGV